VVIATAVTATVAPFLTIIDKALVQRSVVVAANTSQATTTSLLASSLETLASMAKQPVAFCKSPTFLWMWMTYAATYSAANVLRTLCEYRDYQTLLCVSNNNNTSNNKKNNSGNNNRPTKQATTSTTTATLFVGTSMVNSGASLIKDRAYAQLFGNAQTLQVPKISYALWMMRDATVIGSSFVLPAHVSPMLVDITNQRLTPEQAMTTSQLFVPVAAQLVAGPLHFVGLDCYNRNLATTTTLSWKQGMLLERYQFLKSAMSAVVAARMIRVLPGYGVAGVYNTKLRNQYRKYLIERRVTSMMMMQKQQTTTSTTSSSSSATKIVQELVALIRSKGNQGGS
jgi:hypothetical protein